MKLFKVLITKYDQNKNISKEIEYMNEFEIQNLGFDPELTILSEERTYKNTNYKILDIKNININTKKNKNNTKLKL